MNAEVIELLQQAMEARTSTAPGMDVNELADTIADRLAARLKTS
jgi:hypothetical protein